MNVIFKAFSICVAAVLKNTNQFQILRMKLSISTANTPHLMFGNKPLVIAHFHQINAVSERSK
jgi:hypothetical protein